MDKSDKIKTFHVGIFLERAGGPEGTEIIMNEYLKHNKKERKL